MYADSTVMIRVAKQLRQEQVELAQQRRRARAATSARRRARNQPGVGQLDVSLARNNRSMPVWLRRSRRA